MTATVVRCPYCVLSGEFRPMVALEGGAFVCDNCGHMTVPQNRDFRCHCSKCVEMRSLDQRRCS